MSSTCLNFWARNVGSIIFWLSNVQMQRGRQRKRKNLNQGRCINPLFIYVIYGRTVRCLSLLTIDVIRSGNERPRFGCIRKADAPLDEMAKACAVHLAVAIAAKIGIDLRMDQAFLRQTVQLFDWWRRGCCILSTCQNVEAAARLYLVKFSSVTIESLLSRSL